MLLPDARQRFEGGVEVGDAAFGVDLAALRGGLRQVSSVLPSLVARHRAGVQPQLRHEVACVRQDGQSDDAGDIARSRPR